MQPCPYAEIFVARRVGVLQRHVSVGFSEEFIHVFGGDDEPIANALNMPLQGGIGRFVNYQAGSFGGLPPLRSEFAKLRSFR